MSVTGAREAGRARGLYGAVKASPSTCTGHPWHNSYIESFNSRVRDQYLDSNVFWSLAQARVVLSDWKATTTTASNTPRSTTRR